MQKLTDYVLRKTGSPRCWILWDKVKKEKKFMMLKETGTVVTENQKCQHMLHMPKNAKKEKSVKQIKHKCLKQKKQKSA